MELMDGRVVLVTGSTDGIGKATALQLARKGATVLLHGRNRQKGLAVLEDMRRITGSDHLHLYIANLSSLGQVRRLAAQIQEYHDRLHGDLTDMTLTIRRPESIYRAQGYIQNGTFSGRWHFSFADYYDAKFVSFGALRVFNDDTLSPGAVWPLHPHREIEVVTYCAEGEFKHADEQGEGGILKKGWVQHTTVGRGMQHSEINNRTDLPMRFIQMWFLPTVSELEPSAQQMEVEISQRTNRLLPLISNSHPGALTIFSQARVFSCFLKAGNSLTKMLEANWGTYLYLLEGGPVEVNDLALSVHGAAMIRDRETIDIAGREDTEILLVDVML